MYKHKWGIEPILRVLEVAPSTYYSAISRQPSQSKLDDEKLKVEIMRVFKANYCVYGSRKIFRQLKHEGITVGRCRVMRLMKELSITGMIKRKTKNPKTTQSCPKIQYPDDRVKRNFKADKPNELWVSDITYVLTKSGFCYTAFITDVFSNTIVGWMVSKHIDTKLVLDALDMAICTRKGVSDNLVHHSDKGSQYFSNAYREKLDSELIIQSAGTTGDSYDNALSECVNSFYKSELIYNNYLDLEFMNSKELEATTSSYVYWWNNKRSQAKLGYISPLEFEKQYYCQQQDQSN